MFFEQITNKKQNKEMPALILLYLKKMEIFTIEKHILNYGKNMKVSHKHILLNTHKIHGMKSELRNKCAFFFLNCR